MSRKRAWWRYSIALPLTLAIASCTAVPTPAPAPAPTPVAATPRPTPAPVPTPAKAWDERRLDAGEWRYDAAARTASFAQAGVASPLVTMACSGGSIELGAGLGAGETLDVDLRTSAGTDRLRLSGGRVTLGNRDARLDRIAFSRGRFALEASNGSTLTLPVQSEIGRLIEDCRG
ncbi:hypothetical protein ASD67_00205 [Sphingopyxis sp. Root1497]|uniref:hypothetical protein n=1 Tax=Sphingopyxis sp. Root1497 TaxID=1736474 RepID=UPI0006FBDFF2|nr:hypothetical protein [Sphingopyxis sp. Root1497]KQZ65575.1 hypothetical protein ASD67_00205 [Sphingopyxis sp. Root1497]